jgi:hypothetical protein
VYEANAYGGFLGNEIAIRLALRSDSAWSDEDGLFLSDGGVQVDDITVTHLDATDFEDFEGMQESFAWQPTSAPYAGDFGALFTLLDEPDPCLQNSTPGLGFIDDGQGPYNPGYTGSGTGGSTSLNWNYGVAAGWVVNYNGGISAGSLNLNNEWWSPEIDWDLPGSPAANGAEFAGAKLSFSVWNHLPLINGMFLQWSVRGFEQSNGWHQWKNRNFVYYSNEPRWLNRDMVVTDLLPASKEKVQIRLSVRDLAYLFAFPGTDATPSPIFDNVRLSKFAIPGPVITAREIDLTQDSFSQSGGHDVSTRAARDLLDVRVDMARDINTGYRFNVPGDSILVDVSSVLPGVSISNPTQQILLIYSLNLNPLFEAEIRENAPVSSVGTGLHGWDQHGGMIPANQSYTRAGYPMQNRYFFDFPDVDFMYPGDVLEFFIQAQDDIGNITTLPEDLTGFADPQVAYDRRYIMHALPSYHTGAEQPEFLYWNDVGHGASEAAALDAIERFSCNWMQEGTTYDVYTTSGASSMISNGLGSAGAHGATIDQLSGYRVVLYDAGDLSAGLISNGSNSGSDDKSDDAGLLQAWWSALGKDRGIAHFGDNLATMLNTPGSANTYLAAVINASWVGKDIRPSIGNQLTPRVERTGAVTGFRQDYIANGGCLLINQFDSVVPGGGAQVSHAFMDASGSVPVGNAGIYFGWADPQGGQHQSMLFPYGLLYVETQNSAGDDADVRGALVEEVLWRVGGITVPADLCSGAEVQSRSLAIFAPHPNPFNPVTILSFDLGRAAKGSVRIYNLRGALVRTLAQGGFSPGHNELRWNGADAEGAAVASGVYLVDYSIDGFRKSQKVVLLK